MAAKTAKTPSQMERLRAMMPKKSDAEVGAFVKGVTGKTKPSELTEDDVVKIADAVDVLKQEAAP